VTAALQTQGLTKRFGGLTATNEVTFSLERGARHALIGPNGAGKTTFVNLLTGVLPPSAGTVSLLGHDVTQLKPERRVRLGLVRTFQINQLFGALTPLETLVAAIDERRGQGWRWLRRAGTDPAVAREADEIAGRFGLGDVLGMPTETLPYGKQRLLEIAVAFACDPKVLLLDEPAAGVPEAERQDILDAIARLPADVSVLLIEHDMDLVFSFARRISVLVDGALFAEGTPEEIARAPRVRAVYLGEGHDG
jgi:branched-chain amino acid transport system ATP-binding protein